MKSWSPHVLTCEVGIVRPTALFPGETSQAPVHEASQTLLLELRPCLHSPRFLPPQGLCTGCFLSLKCSYFLAV